MVLLNIAKINMCIVAESCKYGGDVLSDHFVNKLCEI